MSLLDRFMDSSQAEAEVRSSVCRNLEMILESRRPFRGKNCRLFSRNPYTAMDWVICTAVAVQFKPVLYAVIWKT